MNDENPYGEFTVGPREEAVRRLIHDALTPPADPLEPVIGPSRLIWQRADAEHGMDPIRQMWLWAWSYGRRFPN